MLEYTLDDLVQVLDGAKNINAALKKFLKHEANSDPKSARFVKDLRVACASKDPNRKIDYIKNKIPDYEIQLLGVARYAYAEPIAQIASEITDKYADEFNATYTQADGGIDIKDTKNFNRIVQESLEIVDKGLEKNNLPNSGFMKSVILYSIFDQEVMVEVIPLAANN